MLSFYDANLRQCGKYSASRLALRRSVSRFKCWPSISDPSSLQTAIRIPPLKTPSLLPTSLACLYLWDKIYFQIWINRRTSSHISSFLINTRMQTWRARSTKLVTFCITRNCRRESPVWVTNGTPNLTSLAWKINVFLQPVRKTWSTDWLKQDFLMLKIRLQWRIWVSTCKRGKCRDNAQKETTIRKKRSF